MCQTATTRIDFSSRSVANVPSLYFPPVQSLRFQHLYITREKVHCLITPPNFITLHINNDSLDRLLALQRHLVARRLDFQSRIREGEVLPGLWPVRVSRQDCSVRVYQSGLDNDWFRDLGIRGPLRLARYVTLPELSGAVGGQLDAKRLAGNLAFVQVERDEFDLGRFGREGRVAAPQLDLKD